MDELIPTIVNGIVNSFDFTFCITVNIATYIAIKLITDIRSKGKISTWNKRIVFLVITCIIAGLYYITGSDVKVIINSIILAPVSWSWIFKPICDKLNIGYSSKVE